MGYREHRRMCLQAMVWAEVEPGSRDLFIMSIYLTPVTCHAPLGVRGSLARDRTSQQRPAGVTTKKAGSGGSTEDRRSYRFGDS